MVETTYKRIAMLPKFGLIIIDECHFGSFKKLPYFGSEYNEKILGVTATPIAETPLANYYDNLILGPTVEELINEKHLLNCDVYGFASDLVSKEKWKIKKGEFESTADFNARKSLALSGRFLGDSTLEDSLAFVTSVTKLVGYDSGFKYAFNADTGDVSLFALPSSSEYSSLNGIGAPDYMTNRRERRGLDRFDLSTKIDSRSAYKGSNAYGATVTVEKTSMSRFGIATNRIPFLNFKRESSYSNPQVSAQFKLENSRAARELPALKVMMVLKLEDPYIVYNFSHVEPKRDNPVDISVQEKFLTGNIIGIVFYSGLTGEVFARLPENLGKTVTRPSE